MALPPQAAPETIESAVRSRLHQVVEHGLDDDVRTAAIARCRKQRLALLCAARTRAEELCQQASWHGNATLVNERTEPRASHDELARVAANGLAHPATVVFHPAAEEEPAWIL